MLNITLLIDGEVDAESTVEPGGFAMTRDVTDGVERVLIMGCNDADDCGQIFRADTVGHISPDGERHHHVLFESSTPLPAVTRHQAQAISITTADGPATVLLELVP